MRYLILFLAGVALMGTLVACNTGGDATEPPPAVQTEAVAAGAEDLDCTEPDEWDEAWTEYYSGGVYLSLARVDVENVTVDSVRGPIPVPETHVPVLRHDDAGVGRDRQLRARLLALGHHRDDVRAAAVDGRALRLREVGGDRKPRLCLVTERIQRRVEG